MFHDELGVSVSFVSVFLFFLSLLHFKDVVIIIIIYYTEAAEHKRHT